MRGTELLYKLELIDPPFLEEAEGQPTRKRAAWLHFGGLAACLCVAAAAAFSFYGPGRLPNPTPGGIAPGPAPSQDISPNLTAEPTAPAQPDVLTVDMDKIYVNEMAEEQVDACRIAYDSELYDDNVTWNAEDVARYYGRTLAPSYVPEGLAPTNPEGAARVVVRRADGAVVEDTVAYGYYQVFGAWENGTPRLIDQRCVYHGFTVAASRVGLIDCCVYLYDEVKQSNIAGVPVTIGYCSMSHGPYDPDTHVPAGYYDLYVAEFTLDSIQFKVTADEMALDEVVKVTASIICPEREIALER